MSRVRRFPTACLLAALLLPFVFLAAGSQPAAAQSLEQRYSAGAAALQAGHAFEALELLGSVEAESPRFRDVQVLLGQACLLADLTRQAKSHFEKALEAQPSNGHVAFLLGFTLYQSSRYFEAEQALDRAQQLAPGNPHPLIYRGLALLRLGRAKEARREIDAALKLAPGESTAQLALAELDLAEGKHSAAQGRARDVLKQNPANPEAEILLGRALLEGGQPGQAASVFGQLLRRQPKRSDLLYLHAQALLRDGRRDAGRAEMKKFQQRKDLEGRMRVLEAAVSTDPQDADSRLELVGMLLDDGAPEGAVLHLSVLQRSRPQDPRVQALIDRLQRLRRGGA